MSGFGYNGEYYDATTGMLNLRARQYEPGMMRFSQQDILRGSVSDPVSLNRYAYCHNNPLSFSDPTGMSIWSKIKSATKSAVKAVKSTAKAVTAKVVSSAAKVTAKVANTVSKVATVVNKVSTSVAKVANNIAANSNSKLVKSLAKGVAKTANKVAKTCEKVATVAKKVEKASTQVAKKYDKIATDSWNDAKTNFQAAAKDFNEAAKEAKEKVTCVAKKAGSAIASAATAAWEYCKENPMEVIHGALDIIGMIPGVGNIADGINAAIYLAEGDYVNAALSAISLIPMGGALAAVGKVAAKSDGLIKMVAKYGDEVVEGVARYGDEIVEGIARHGDEAIGAAKKATNAPIAPNTSVKKSDIIAALDGATPQSTEIARSIQQGEVGTNILGDELMDRYFGSAVAYYQNGQMYLRKSSSSIMSDAVHEGTHYLDDISGTLGTTYQNEIRAFSAERDFQIATGQPADFDSVEDIIVHVYNNY